MNSYENEPRRIKMLLEETEAQGARITELEKSLKKLSEDNAALKMLLSEYDLQYGPENYQAKLEKLEDLQKNIWKLGEYIRILSQRLIAPSDTVDIKKKELKELVKLQETVEKSTINYLKVTSSGLHALLTFQANKNSN